MGDRIKELAADLTVTNSKLDRLWEDSGKPQGKAWEAIARPAEERRYAVERELGVLLLDWAEAQDPPLYYVGVLFGPRVRDYRPFKARMDQKLHGNTISRIVGDAFYDRAERDGVEIIRPGLSWKDQLVAQREQVERVRAMSTLSAVEAAGLHVDDVEIITHSPKGPCRAHELTAGMDLKDAATWQMLLDRGYKLSHPDAQIP
jgi:hypothetical protein